MKLRIKGDYVKGLLEFIPCQLIIEFGKIQSIKFNESQHFYNYVPSYNSEFEIEKIYYDKYSKNLKYTYRLLYHNESKETKIVNIKPNRFQVFQIKWAFKKYLIQSNDIKIDVLKYFLTAFFSFIGGIIYERNQIEKPTPETTPINEPKAEIKKSLDTKILKMDNKKDSIIIK